MQRGYFFVRISCYLEDKLKRSQVNQIIENAIEFCNRMHFLLPPFAFWTIQDWQSKGVEYREIRDNPDRLGYH